MAIYRLEADVISRRPKGWREGNKIHSSVEASAYCTGTDLWDERNHKTHPYKPHGDVVVTTTIIAPTGAPDWVFDRSQLWNKVEAGEKRKDAQLARTFLLALPKELSQDKQFQLAVDWARKEFVSFGMVAEVSLHRPKVGDNWHAHLEVTMRPLEGDEFGLKHRDWNTTAQLRAWRKSWGDAENAALEKAGRPERVDHRSLKDQGIDQIPQPKIGKAAMGMKRRGVEDPERFRVVRWIKALNAVMPWARSIERGEEIHQHGMGKTWWERSLIFMADTGKAARDSVFDSWQSLVHSRRPDGPDMGRHGREPDRDPEISR